MLNNIAFVEHNQLLMALGENAHKFLAYIASNDDCATVTVENKVGDAKVVLHPVKNIKLFKEQLTGPAVEEESDTPWWLMENA